MSQPNELNINRRSLLKAGTLAVGAASLPGSAVMAAEGHAAPKNPEPGQVEWRNKQPGMAYRQLGRTGLMVSEVVAGGDPITLDNYKHMEMALEMGLNYLDMAPAYNNGDTERAFGKFLAESSSRREKVFLTTKISDFTKVREGMYKDVFKDLPESKQTAIRQRAAALRDERGIDKPGYFLEYFPGEKKSFDSTYLRVAMLEEFGAKIEGSPKLRQVITESLEGSLKRVKVDYFDNMMCPHGAGAPEDLTPELAEVFNDLKQQGKVRFLGVTSHNDPAGVLKRAAELGHYDLAMIAYNVINGGYVDSSIRLAASKGMGLVAMKTAHAVATHHKELQPVPEWRVAKVDRIVPGDLKAPQKAYLWSLQNPKITAVISNLWDETSIKENLTLAGKKVELHSA